MRRIPAVGPSLRKSHTHSRSMWLGVAGDQGRPGLLLAHAAVAAAPGIPGAAGGDPPGTSRSPAPRMRPMPDASPPAAGPRPEPFVTQTAPAVLDDLRARLRATRWPDAPEDAGWSL